MRISDLSSDVCSSDLPGLAAAEAIARRLRLAIRQPEDAFGHDQVQIAGHRTDRAVAVQHFDICRGKIGLEMDEAAKIGREQCRERVSKYVWISVGAVS